MAPLSMLACAATWRAATCVEVYGPLATLLLGATLALRRERWLPGSALLAWAVMAHPAAWALVPGLLLLSGAGRSAAVRAVAVAASLHVACLLLLWPDWWSGPRGLLHTAPADVDPWRSLQRAWRMVARDMGIAALPLLAGAAFVGRRRLAGLGAVVLGSALALDRHSDNPGHLPSLWLCCCFAPTAVSWLPEIVSRGRRRVAILGATALLLLGVAEATSRHDAVARAAVREADRLLEGGCGERSDLPWGSARKLELLCMRR